MRTYLAAVTTVLALGALTACGDDATTADDPAGTARDTPDGTAAETSGSPSGAPGPGTYPEFEAEDYTFTLEIVCFCPISGPVQVTVEDGEAVSGVVTKGGRGIEKGAPAPEFYLTTIDEIIAEANDPGFDEVDVVWPEGQDWPRKVSIDRDERAVDDEVTYRISDVQVTG